MIRTGNTLLNENSTSGKIIVYNDVNSENISEVATYFKDSNKFIDKKFDMPLSSESKTYDIKAGTAMSKIMDKISSLNASDFLNDTQLKNFKLKVTYWCTEYFKDILAKFDSDNRALVFIDNNVSKHEWTFIQWLCEIGIDFVIITQAKLDKAQDSLAVDYKNYNTTAGLDYKKEASNLSKVRVNSLSEIEKAIYENNDSIKVIVNGISNITETSDFYGKLHVECSKNEKFMLITNGFDKPTYNETEAIPRLKIDKHDYITLTLQKFVKVEDVETVRNALNTVFNNENNKNLNSNILYNRMVNTICSLNRLLDRGIKTFVYYGEPSVADVNTLECLSFIEGITVLVLVSDKSKNVKISGYDVLELSDSKEYFEMPIIDTRENSKTQASIVQNVVDQTLFSGDTLGMYRPGQFSKFSIKHFNTTYDEIDLWWNKEMYIRPGFEASGNSAVIPTMCKLITGVDGTVEEYNKRIQRVCCGPTFLCEKRSYLQFYIMDNPTIQIVHLTDVNKTKYDARKPFFENGKLVRDRIKNDVNYRYGVLSSDKEDLVLDKIEEVITGGYIDTRFTSNENFIDTVLNILLNMKIATIRKIQQFEVYSYNPNLIMILDDEDMLTLEDIILITFMRLIGFDILIFVPTCYSSIEKFYTSKFQYDIHRIGEANCNIGGLRLCVTDNIEVKQDKEKKKGFFKNLFSKGE